MRRILVCLVAVVALIGWVATPAWAGVRVVTTLPEFADLARQVGGGQVEASSVMRGPENVHNVLATPAQMARLARADAFVHSGLDTEPWRDNFVRGARNPRVLDGKPGNIDLSAGIDLLGVPVDGRGDRSKGDMHAFGNPHYSNSPVNAAKMAGTLADGLARVDPANAALYRDNAARFATDVTALHAQLLEQLKPLGTVKVVTYHRAWDYFARDFGLQVVGTIEAKVGVTPTPGETRDIIDTMKREGVKVVIVETYNDFSRAKFVAEQAGAKVVVLPDHVNGVPDVKTYQDLFRYNVGKIVEAAK
jgi:ABC-type Zn uptake system ZnuABC Zn-binding protein ZnuA